MSILQPETKFLNYPINLKSLSGLVKDKQFVCIGEASHGTSEFYVWRALISQFLIKNHGFKFIAVEGDWPDCYRINSYVKGYPDSGRNGFEVLNNFERWPTWMWANWEMVAFIEWLKEFNSSKKGGDKVGFYGVDVYSLRESLAEVLGYLKDHDKEGYKIAKKVANCFEPYGRDAQDYAFGVRLVPQTCEKEVLELLNSLRKKVAISDDLEKDFNAKQNALVLKNAERYYRSMIMGGALSWNIRDKHMVEVLERLMDRDKKSKAIVWAHNTHIGDARATSMKERGMVNIGQLLREKYGTKNVTLIGMGTYKGKVIAAEEWEEPMQRMNVPEALEGSWEELFHKDTRSNDIIVENTHTNETLNQVKGHRAIGVVYDPRSEMYGNYVPTNLERRYDSFLYIDQTHALHPIHIEPERISPPDTYPWGL